MATSITLSPSGKSVPCAPGDTVLGALEQAGYALPNNCRAGACGECKTKVLDGEVDQGSCSTWHCRPPSATTAIA